MIDCQRQRRFALEDVETQHGVEDAAAANACNIVNDEEAKARRANCGHPAVHLEDILGEI